MDEEHGPIGRQLVPAPSRVLELRINSLVDRSLRDITLLEAATKLGVTPKDRSTAAAPLDPEWNLMGIKRAIFHFDGGARTFDAFARRMIDDMGEAARPWLGAWYVCLRLHPENKRFMAETTPSIEMDATIARWKTPAPRR